MKKHSLLFLFLALLSLIISCSDSQRFAIEKGKVGPVDKGDYVGGNYLTALNFSATLPNLLPGLQNVDFGMFFIPF